MSPTKSRLPRAVVAPAPANCALCGQTLADPDVLAHYKRRLAQRDTDARTQLRAEIAAEYAARERAQAKQRQNAAEATVEKRYEQRFLQMETNNQGLRQQLEIHKRRLEGLSPNNRGRFNEEELLAELRVEFPHDRLELVRSGPAQRPDILHEVRCADRQVSTDAGRIVYECKDSLRWSGAFVAQAGAARDRHLAAHAILVSRAFPSGCDSFTMIDDVVVVDAEGVRAIARILRRGMVQLAQLKLNDGQRGTRGTALLRYLTSDDFAISFGAVRGATALARKSLAGERGWHDRAWAKREHCYRRIEASITDIDESIGRVINGASDDAADPAATLTLVSLDGDAKGRSSLSQWRAERSLC